MERERPVRNTGCPRGQPRCTRFGRCGWASLRAKDEACKAGDRREPNRRAAGRSPDVAPMVGDRMVGSPKAEIRETRRGQAVFMAAMPEEPPGGSQSVRSSVEAGNDRGAKGRRKVEVRRTERRKSKPTRVPARASRWWNQPSAIGLDRKSTRLNSSHLGISY